MVARKAEEAPEDLGDVEIDIVTTAPGTFDAAGIAEIGSKRTLPCRKFSKHWMKPATAASAKKLNAYVEATSPKD